MIKWIGQHIVDFIARFRNDVYLEDIADGTVVDNKFLGLDTNNKIVKEAASTTVTDLHTAGVDGDDGQVLTDKGDGTIDSEAKLIFNGSTLSIGADANSTADALFIDCNNLESGSAIEIDIDHGTTTALNSATTTNIINIDYDKSANHTSGNRYVKALNIDMNDTATGNSANYFMYGLDMDLTTANANGIMGQIGVRSIISGGDTNHMYGIYQMLDDGSVDFKAVSSANASDYFTMATGANGATTLTTVDDGVDSLAHFEIAADGNIILDPAGTIALEANTEITGSLTIGGHAIADIDVGSEFEDEDDHVMSSGAIKEYVSSHGIWHAMIYGYATSVTSTTNYYHRMSNTWLNWTSATTTNPTSFDSAYGMTPFFIAHASGKITKINVQGESNTTDPFKFYFYKAGASNDEASMTLTLMGSTAAITPDTANKSYSYQGTVDFSFATNQRLYAFYKKDSNSGSTSNYWAISVSGEYT